MLKAKLMELIAEGKSNADIAKAVAGIDEAKAMDIEALVKAIEEARSAKKLEDALNAKELNDKAAAEKAAAQEEMKKEILKSINVQPQVSAPTKRFDMVFGKEVELSNHDQKAHEELGSLLKAIGMGDVSAARSISKNIITDNAQYGRKDARTDADANGGYAIPTTVEDSIMKFSYEQTVMLQSAKRVVVPYETHVIPTMGSVSAVYIANQETAATESNSTFTGPEINMQRVGVFTNISNDFSSQRPNIVSEFVQSYSSAMARFLDLHIACGSIDGNSDLIDGLIFQTLMGKETPIVRTALDLGDLTAMTNNINSECNKDALKFICNRKVYNQIAALTDTEGASARLFPQFLSGGKVSPLGIEMLENNKIPSTLGITEDKRTTYTDDALILVDTSKFIIGMSNGLRIDLSKDFNFTTDQTTIRGIQKIGWVLPLAAARVLELTN